MIDSVVTVLGEGFGNYYCVAFAWYSGIGFLRHTLTATSSSTFVATVETSFAVAAFPFVRQLVVTDSRVAIVRCQLVVTISVSDLTKNTITTPTVLVFQGLPKSIERVAVLVLGVDMSVVRNMTGIPRSSTAFAGVPLGCVGLTYFSFTNISQSTIEVTESNLSIEEVGADAVAPYAPAAALGFAFATVTYSLHISVAALLMNSNVTISNSRITVHRSVVDDAVIAASPGVQSGIVFWSLTAVALSGPTLWPQISVKATFISVSTLVYPDQSSPLLSVWCVVAAVSNIAPNVAFAAEDPIYSGFATILVNSNFSSLDINNSLIEITNTTMQLTPLHFSQLATPVRAASQRILFGMVVCIERRVHNSADCWKCFFEHH
ncbi:transmembrane protein, putative [Bodo saltans]|uniref:Transmembrane protein, putative n=1 Tax=Bodo saltans TaxID=75058 RepID=A0A0S4J4C5_BODSA|nr:transmembrane protein, putative [Bodo saltans]|eukprot:CUG75747.1 transmembrane protein, putative [Bodo saltans]